MKIEAPVFQMGHCPNERCPIWNELVIRIEAICSIKLFLTTATLALSSQRERVPFMALLQPKLSLKVSQRQVLTPGLMQMVSVLALNKLELKEMIDAEMVENPVLEEIDEIGSDAG